MKQLILNKKTGFKNLTLKNPIIIRDFRGKMFYSTVGLRPVKVFNLPQGTYLIDEGNFKPLKRPVNYELSVLPFAERKFNSPSDFTIEFDYNPNKCTIKWLEKRIIFDNELKEKTLPELFFILYHEYGHAKYTTEKFADLYAKNKMLVKGYNPSQIGKAPITSLSSMQYERKKFIVNKLINP
jgi:hypothetical protein